MAGHFEFPAAYISFVVVRSSILMVERTSHIFTFHCIPLTSVLPPVNIPSTSITIA